MNTDQAPIQVGISACLTGQNVRYDSGHKRSNFCMDVLSEHVQYQSFCPEVAIGLPIPRPTIRQVKHGDIIHLTRSDGEGDVTEAMQIYSESVAQQVAHLSGFIFTAKSPSCGMERVKVYHAGGQGSQSDGVGLFAAAIMRANPLIPCEENGRLNDPLLRENFVLRVFAYHHWQQLAASGITRAKLFDFQARYKYLLMSHCSGGYSALGKLLAQSTAPIETVAADYIQGFMDALKVLATRKTHTNTLMHIQGYFNKQLDKQQRAELTEQIHAYRNGLVPLYAPLTLIQHYLKQFEHQYLNMQIYFNPHPANLRLRYSF